MATERKHWHNTDWVAAPIRLGLAMALGAALTGCVGYVDGGGGTVAVAAPDVYVFGGGFERGHDVRAYSHRGFASRAVAHPGRGERRR